MVDSNFELNALVQVVQVTDDQPRALAKICNNVDGLTVEDAHDIPYLLVGTVDEIVDKIHNCQQRWGISYFVVRTLEGFEPVLRSFFTT